MTIQQFNSLPEIDKVVAIIESGRLLAQNIEDSCRTFLYKLGTFYVSATYKKESDDLDDIQSYDGVHQSTPHFRKVFISIHPAARTETLN